MDTLGSDGTITDHVWGRNWPEMVENFPSEAHPASDIDFRTDIVKSTLIHNTKWMLVVQMGPS